MKNEDKFTPLDIIGLGCFLSAIVIGFIWIDYLPVSLLILVGWLCLFISYLKTNK